MTIEKVANPNPEKIDYQEWENLWVDVNRFASANNMTFVGLQTLQVFGDVFIGMESDFVGISEKGLYTDLIHNLADVDKVFQSSCIDGNLEIETPSCLVLADKGLFSSDNGILIRSKSGGLVVQIIHQSGNKQMNTFALFSPNGKPKMRGLIIV